MTGYEFRYILNLPSSHSEDRRKELGNPNSIFLHFQMLACNFSLDKVNSIQFKVYYIVDLFLAWLIGIIVLVHTPSLVCS